MGTTAATAEFISIAARAGQPARNQICSSLTDVARLLGVALPAAAGESTALFHHRRVKPGEHVYRAGQAFDALYLVNCGFLKAVAGDAEGNERVLSFPMKGNLLGCDGIGDDRHSVDAIALTDCDLIVLPFAQLLRVGREDMALEHLIYRIISREIMLEHAHFATLSALPADARVARFLAMQAQRHSALGFSPRCFMLRMTRREIGSYLGLTLETVSRALSALDAAGVVSVDQRKIEILKPELLRGTAKSGPAPAARPLHANAWRAPMLAAA